MGETPEDGQAGFWAIITASASAGDNKWTYTFAEVANTAYGGWTTKAAGFGGTAHNTLECMNSAAGTQGNGVDVANLDTADYTATIQACPAGAIVRMWKTDFRADDTSEAQYWFVYANGIDVSCD